MAGTDRMSNHWHGRGVDIYALDGQLVSRNSSASRAFAIEALALAPPGRATEIGLPWADPAAEPGVFSDAHHQGHLHSGWR